MIKVWKKRGNTTEKTDTEKVNSIFQKKGVFELSESLSSIITQDEGFKGQFGIAIVSKAKYAR